MWTPHREKDLLISFFIAITIVITIHYHFNQLNVQFIHSLWLAMKTKRFFQRTFHKNFQKKILWNKNGLCWNADSIWLMHLIRNQIINFHMLYILVIWSPLFKICFQNFILKLIWNPLLIKTKFSRYFTAQKQSFTDSFIRLQQKILKIQSLTFD